MKTAPIANLLSRLSGVRKTGPGKWSAHCPAHEDRTPSLGVKVLEDGRILAHCFSGCAIESITAAIGLTVGDLFPKNLDRNSYNPEHRREASIEWKCRDVLRHLGFELTVILVSASQVAQGHALQHEALLRMAQAMGRVEAAIELAGIEESRHV